MEAQQIFILCSKISARLQFVADYIFTERFGLDVKLITQESEAPSGAAVIIYGNRAEGYCLPNSGLMEETGIAAAEPEVAESDGVKVLFPVAPSQEKNFTLPFDVFSAVFWMLSRYEEYGPSPRDKHGRFPATQSLAARENFLEIPVVDLWIDLLKKKFTKYFPNLRLKKEKFSVEFTYDIDQAYCYAGKSFFRSIGGFARQVARGEISLALKRLAVKSSMTDDPFDVFSFIEQVHKGHFNSPIIFWQVGPHAQYDKNLPVFHPMMLNIIAKTKKFTKPALHPSYGAATDAAEIKKQKQDLQGAAETVITQSRQHYIRLIMPQTYRALTEAGIAQDYSMGYPDAVGFRAGTAHAFYWYDLQREDQTELQLIPFCIMDVTLKNYLKLSPAEAMAKLAQMIDEVRQVNGTFIPVWHNESLSEYGNWKGWRSVFEYMVQYLGRANEN